MPENMLSTKNIEKNIGKVQKESGERLENCMSSDVTVEKFRYKGHNSKHSFDFNIVSNNFL